MKKVIVVFLSMIVFALIPFISYAANSPATFVYTNSLYYVDSFYSTTFDNLALDFTVAPALLDVINTFTVKNIGNARENYEIDKLVLYEDDGDGVFQGIGVDKKIADSVYDMTANSWVFNNLNVSVPLTSSRFFLSVETSYNGADSKTFQLYIPKYNDVNSNGTYDVGDDGLFLLSGEKLPTADLYNEGYARYKKYSFDTFGPKINVSNLPDNSYFKNVESFIVKGAVRDQGGSGLSSLEICINLKCEPVTKIDGQKNWTFDWALTNQGINQVYLKAIDLSNNESRTEVVSVNVEIEEFISYKYSSIIFDKSVALANGQDKVTVAVVVKNQYDKPVEGQLVEVKTTDTAIAVDKSYGYSDKDGNVQFVSWSPKAGNVVYKFYFNGEKYSADYQVMFGGNGSTTVNYLSGRWIKLKSQSAVYFLDKDNVRHTYPTQKVWVSYFGNDFKNVEVISDDEMDAYKLGRNVPFKVGTLMKIPSVKKVYEVTAGGVINWLKTEAVAISRFGTGWAKKVNDLPESFFMDYTEGLTIE